MQTSALGRQFIQSFEKCRLTAYVDAVGVLTIAWGRTTGVKAGDTCTQEQADDWFEEELHAFERAVEGLCHVPLSPRQFDALVSFAYNVGVGALGMSTLLRRLNEHNYVAASDQFQVWNKGTVNGKLQPLAGLTKRRLAEAKIFSFGIYEMHDGPTIDGNSMPDFSDTVAGHSGTG